MEYKMPVDEAIHLCSACTFIDNELSKRILKRVVKREYVNGVRPDYVVFDANDADFIEAMRYYRQKQEEDKKLDKTAGLNNEGIALEKAGDIDGAIAVYEKCAAIGYPADHCYERLRILYKKRKDYENMIRIIRRTGEVFGELPSAIEEKIRRNLPKRMLEQWK